MPYLYSMGKIILFLGLVLVIVGGVLMLSGKTGILGRLPGDIFIDRGNLKFYFPLATMLLLSIVLSLILNFIFRK